MRRLALVISLLLLLVGLHAWAAEPTTPPTRDGILALAARYRAEVTPTLSLKQKTAIDNLATILDGQRNVPAMQAQSIEDLVNHCTLALANADGLEAVIATASLLVLRSPNNARTVNLLGATLHAIGKNPEAVAAFEYAHTLQPTNELVMLNAANTHLDLDQDARAKELIDAVIARNPKNKSAYSALACYWFKKGDMKQSLDALAKAASLGGMVVQKITKENDTVTDTNTVKGSDPVDTMEQKLAKVNNLVPKTTADLIEGQFPDAAKQIRDRYGKLADTEKMIMPPLPQVNTSGVRAWQVQGEPYVVQWQEAFEAHANRGLEEIDHLRAGVNPGDSEAVVDQKAAATVKAETAQALANAQKMLKAMENMPGITAKDLDEARQALRDAMAEQGVTPADDTSAANNGAINSDEDLVKVEAAYVPAGWDSGGVFSATNYRDYLRIRDSYMIYFNKFYKEYMAKTMDILKVYGQKKAEEEKTRDDRIALLEADIMKASEESHGSGKCAPCVIYSLEIRKENLRFKKAVNKLGEDFFAQWVNLALPQYTQKMKPTLDAYWAVNALYIRNMNNEQVMKTEYLLAKMTFWKYGSLAVGTMNLSGTFAYLGETDEEEAQLRDDIRANEEDAKTMHDEYVGETHAASEAIARWLDDNFALGLSGEFVTLKVTPRRITFEEYIAGMNFKHVFDFKTGEWTTYRSFAAKIDIGFQVGGLKVGAYARADILESYDTYNVGSGKLVNAGSSFAKGSAGIGINDPHASTAADVQVTIDPAAESEFSYKFNRPSVGANNPLWKNEKREGEKAGIGIKSP